MQSGMHWLRQANWVIKCQKPFKCHFLYLLEVADCHYWYSFLCDMGWGGEKGDKSNYFEGKWYCLSSLELYIKACEQSGKDKWYKGDTLDIKTCEVVCVLLPRSTQTWHLSLFFLSYLFLRLFLSNFKKTSYQMIKASNIKIQKSSNALILLHSAIAFSKLFQFWKNWKYLPE